LYVHIYTKLYFLHFIQLSLTMTTLCHIKHDQLENFYISPEKKHEKLPYCCNGVTDHHKIWWWGTSLKFTAIKSFNFKNPRRQTATSLKIVISHWCRTSFERIGVRHRGFLHINCLTACARSASSRQILSRSVIPLQRYQDFLWSIFLVKCINSLNGRA